MTTGPDGEAPGTEVDAAGAVLAAHVPDAAGFCAGCREQWDRLVPHSGCTQAAWAREVMNARRRR